MAEKRMFSKKIVSSDAFLEMPLSSQALYFHLAMYADDDGFVSNPRKITRMVNAAEDDLKILLTKKFVLAFEIGVIVIKHWRINNYIRPDRYRPTTYLEQAKQLYIKDNKSYTFDSAKGKPLTEYLLEKPKGEEKGAAEDKPKRKKEPDKPQEKQTKPKSKYGTVREQIEVFSKGNKELADVLNEFVAMRGKKRNSPTEYGMYLLLRKLVNLAGENNQEAQMEIVRQSILNGWTGLFELKPYSQQGQKGKKQEQPIPEWYDKYREQTKDYSKQENLTDEETRKILEEMASKGG